MKHKKSRQYRYKEPSLFRKLVDIHYEQAKRRKALRILTKQAWSFDFLSLMLINAGKQIDKGLQLEITDRNGLKVLLTYDKAVKSDAVNNLSADDSIFNHLDDDVAVDRFISEHSRR